MKRVHSMPFGAKYCPGSGVRFRLWAPQSKEVGLCLWQEDQAEECRGMSKVDEGWFESVHHDARPGSRYKFQIDGGIKVPDPASRFQPDDVHGPSEVVDPAAFDWQDINWQGRPWEEAVIYELHLGTFTPEGTFAAAEKRLPYLAELGVTAVELMPVADFPGARNWGYDGVLQFAPDSWYGRPEDLKHLIQTAHGLGLMVFLDVVYNHFGPEGNYLHAYAPQFFTKRHRTPWGDAINFDGPDSRPVRDFFINNALYWLNEFHFDGLRFDAVHAIVDDSKPDILTELAGEVRKRVQPGRHVHLVLENDNNAARYLRRSDGTKTYDAQWNDDIHHSLHVVLTGEKDGYYADYADFPVRHLGRCLTQGFDYQGESSAFRDGERRGEPSRDLPLASFVSFLQNHDQIGNRAFGERIGKLADERALRAGVTMLLLAPSPPLLFMGQEFKASTPFLFFCDFEGDLSKAVTEGRRNEFARFAQFTDPAARAQIPDPSARETFEGSKLDWQSASQPGHQEWLEFYRKLLKIRHHEIVPRIQDLTGEAAQFEVIGDRGLLGTWNLRAGEKLRLIANFSDKPIAAPVVPAGRVLYATGLTPTVGLNPLPEWSAVWFLEP
jgi:maltooligosyltrehalose trehalohydrolase